MLRPVYDMTHSYVRHDHFQMFEMTIRIDISSTIMQRLIVSYQVAAHELRIASDCTGISCDAVPP